MCENNTDMQKLIFSEVCDTMKFTKNEEVTEYVAYKLIDNMHNYTDFAILKQSYALLTKLRSGINIMMRMEDMESEISANLKESVERTLKDFADENDRSDSSDGSCSDPMGF